MMLGDSSTWANRFISADERILERIVSVWPQCVSLLPPNAEEDTITINLVHLLAKDAVVRRICHWIEFQFEPFGTLSTGAKFSKGKIDLAVLLDWERERYVAYECKRLNVINGGKRSSLAALYVSAGMMRFMTEQYAEALPIGCMLGYVLDGDMAFALSRVSAAISSHPTLGLTSGPVSAPPLQFASRFLTMHSRPAGTNIQLRHALLPFPIIQSSASIDAE